MVRRWRSWYWMLAEFAGFGVMAALIVIFTVFMTYGVGNFSCKQLGVNASVETKWTFWSGCLVKLDKGWIPEQRWRGTE